MSEVAVLSRCKNELAEIKDLPQILQIRDKAKAIADYLKVQGEGIENANLAKQIVALSEANAGRLIREMQSNGELVTQGGDRNSKSQVAILKLSDLGVSLSQSSRWQTAAVVLEEDPGWFDKHLAECNEHQRDYTQQAVIRRGKQLRNDSLGETTVEAPDGEYDVIVIDPPWDMKKIEREVAPNQSAFDYPTMSEDELAQLTIPAAENCHLWLWTTHKFLPMALRLVPVWGFKYVCSFVWHKPGGFQPFNLPQYNCEFAIYCRKGAPKFVETKAFPVCFQSPRGSHSEKPSAFYDVIRRVTDGQRLDMFNRRKIEGFTGWGNEAD